jgi:chromosome segregation ATPase
MTLTTEVPPPGGRTDPSAAADAAETLASLRRQMAALEEQLEAVNRQQTALRAALNQLLARFPEGGQAADTGSVGEASLQRCASDIVRVLREVGRPLGALEILEAMAARHLSWRESTVRHALADLKNEGVVREGDGERSLSYSLARP